jgi:hypothetical protein
VRAIETKFSYGWIIQIGDHQIAKGKRPTFVSDPPSFRAEGYGMASAMLYLRLLQRQIEFTRGPRAVNKVICDNQALLLRIAEASEWTYTTPNITLRAEWDVESVILTLQQELNLRFEYVHVKSHHDNSTPMHGLSLEVRLTNVEADRLTTEYMTEDKERRPTVSLFLSVKAQLIINDDSVTRKLPLAIHYAAGSILIRPYLMNIVAWTEQTLDSINWDAHGAGHLYHQPYRCYLVKLCHWHLPIGKLLHRQDTKYSPTCPGCRDATEDQDHYLQCEAPSRIKWRISLITALHKQLAWFKMDGQFQEMILKVIDNTLADRVIPMMGPFQAAH